MFSFFLENTATKKKTENLLTLIIKSSFLAPSFRQPLVLVLCFYRLLVELYWYANANAVIWLAEPLHIISH